MSVFWVHIEHRNETVVIKSVLQNAVPDDMLVSGGDEAASGGTISIQGGREAPGSGIP